MNEEKEKPERHPDLFTRVEAAYYLRVADLSKLPEHLRPHSLKYGRGLYHRGDLDDVVERARHKTTPRKSKGLHLRKA